MPHGSLSAFSVSSDLGSCTLDGTSGPAIKYQGATYQREAVDGSTTGRNQEGDMIRDFITQKVKWQLEFSPCTRAQLSALLSVVDGEKFTFTYPSICGAGSGEFYVGSRSAPFIFYSDAVDDWLCGGLTMNFIEL